MRIALAQINLTVGDLKGNAERMLAFAGRAKTQNVDLIVFPELAVAGYPPEDLLFKKHFSEDNRTTLDSIAAGLQGICAVTGFADPARNRCHNSVAFIRSGKIDCVYHKVQLPNYGVFDEQRLFSPGHSPCVIEISGVRIALTICEDIWLAEWLEKFLSPCGRIDLLINVSASPFHSGKVAQRSEAFAACARRLNCAVAYCNLVGGQDELVFDGQSMLLDAQGNVLARAAAFAEDMLIFDMKDSIPQVIKAAFTDKAATEIDIIAETYDALVLGTGDYVRKNGFGKVVIGLSGGIDSALTAAIAVDAIGKENVIGITMPSRFNSAATISDAEKCARNLGIEFHTLPIGDMLRAFDNTLSAIKGWTDKGLAYENLQARIRGTLLMSLSNQFGWLVLTTGNKSETAVGYSTLYGDTAGGFAVIKDVPKTLVYKLSRYVNKKYGSEIIPDSVIDRAPSAELRENQKDTDSLPEYEILDRIIAGYVEQDRSAAELIAAGESRQVVSRVVKLIDRNEYKRRQCPPGIKITPKAFGRDRRMPITNKYNDRV